MPDNKPRKRQTPREIQKEVDKVLASDRPALSVDAGPSKHPAIYAGNRPNVPIGSVGASGDTSSNWAPIQPAAEPVPGSKPSLVDARSDTSTYGVSGTPITSAFLQDLGEYNPLLMGRYAVPTWEKMRRGDDMVWAIRSVWALPVLSAKWDIVEAEPGSPAVRVSSTGEGKSTKAKAKEVRQFVRENLFGGLEFQTSTGAWVSQSWQSVIKNASRMIDFGCAVYEEVWHQDGDKLRLRALQDRQALTFYRWHTEPDGETLIGLEQYGYRGNAFMNVTLPIEKMCRFTYNQEGANFFGIPLLRALYSAWFFKDRLKRIGAIAAEKNMLGVPVWRLVPGFNVQDKDAAFNFVTQMTASEITGAVEPPQPVGTSPDTKSGFRFETPQATRQALTGLLQWVNYYDICMARAALAMFMSSGTTPFGNRSTTKEHADFFLLAAQSLADQIKWEMQTATVRRLCWYNFGSDAPVPELVAANVQARQLEDMADLLTKLGQMGLVVSDQGIRDWLRKEVAAPKETRDGLVAIRGETIDVGMPGGASVTGKGGMPIAAPGVGESTFPKGAPPPGASPNEGKQPPGQFYHLLPKDNAKIAALRPGDEFQLDRPVLFGERARDEQGFTDTVNRGPTLLVQGRTSNGYLKGRFQVRSVDEAGNIQAENIE